MAFVGASRIQDDEDGRRSSVRPRYSKEEFAQRGVEDGEEASIIREMREEPACMVLMHTGFGGIRMIDMLVGDPLPRIC